MLRKAFISGLVACGVNVYDLENLPRPVVKYAARLDEVQGGVYINTCLCDREKVEATFFDREGIDLDKNQLKKIETLFIREDFRKARVEELGEISQLNHLLDFYTKALINCLPKESIKNRKLKLVVDYNHSNTCLILPSVLERLGCEVVSLNAYVDEGKAAKNKEDLSYLLKQLSTMVMATNSDLGILVDSKGEKIYLVDDQGRITKDNQLLILIVLYRLQRIGQGRVALPVTIPWFMENLLQKYQGEVIRTKANCRALLEETKTQDVILAGNEDGCVIFPEFNKAFDAMRAIGEMLRLLSEESRSLSNLLDSLPKLVYMRDSVFCSWGLKGKIMRTLIQEMDKEKVDLLDGIRIFVEQDSILILPDGEQPLFHLFAEGVSGEKVKSLLEKYARKIKQEQRSTLELKQVT